MNLANTFFSHPGRADGRRFQFVYVVQPADTDGLGHVNNVRYLHWCEWLAWQHSSWLGAGLPLFCSTGNALVAHRHILQYQAPCFAGERLLLETRITSASLLKIKREYSFYRLPWLSGLSFPAAGSAPVFIGETDWVSIDMTSGQPRRMLPALQRCYAEVLGGAAVPASMLSSFDD